MPFKNPEDTKSYQRDYHKRRRERNRREYIEKRGGCCEDCFCTISLQFHHRDPETKFTHRIFNYSKERIEIELSKCDLLCITCHRKAHKKINKEKRIRLLDAIIDAVAMVVQYQEAGKVEKDEFSIIGELDWVTELHSLCEKAKAKKKVVLTKDSSGRSLVCG